MRVKTGMRSAPARVGHRQKVALSGLLSPWTMAWRGARDVRAGQNCAGGRWTGKPRERQRRACAQCRDDTVWCQATLLLLSGLSPTILLLLLSATKLLLLIRTGCPSWWVVVCPVHEASWPGSRALITVLMLQSFLNGSCSWVFSVCRCRSTVFQAKPSQAKELTGGGDLREAQVDVPLSVSHSCVWTQCWAH